MPADHDVLRLEVTVNDAVLVGERERAAQLGQDLHVGAQEVTMAGEQRRPRRVGSLGEELPPGDALDPLHDEDRLSGRVDADRMHGHEVRVLERAHDPRLADERSCGRRIGGPNGLHGDLSAE